MNITDGMLRCRHRDDPARPSLLEPGREYDLVIAMPDTANVFGAGHRIRVDITSSNFPRCDVNPNTGGPVMGARTFEIARNVIHTGTSYLRLDTSPPDKPPDC
jgi:predicted acyl esterase